MYMVGCHVFFLFMGWESSQTGCLFKKKRSQIWDVSCTWIPRQILDKTGQYIYIYIYI